MLKHASLFFLLFGVALAKGDHEKEANCSLTDETIKLEKDDHAYINCQNAAKWQKINVTVDGGANTDGGLSLYFTSVLSFKDPKPVKVYAVPDDKTEKLIYEGLPLGKIWLPTGQNKIRVVVVNDQTGSISVKVMLACGGTFDEPSFVSPILPNQPLPAPVTVNCAYKFTKPASVDFTKFALGNGSEASFTGTEDDILAGPFSTKGPDHIIIVKVNALLTLKLNLSNTDQSVAFDRTVLSGDICGKAMNSIDKQTTLSTKGIKDAGPVSCLWLVAAPENQQISLSVGNVSLQHVDDIVSVVDAGNPSGTPLLQITALNKKTVPVISSQRYLVVSLDSKKFNDGEEFSFTVSPISGGGHLSESGTMNIRDSSTFILSTGSDKNLYVSFSKLTKLADGQKIVVSADSVEIVTFDSKMGLFDLSSPGSELQIAASGFPSTGVNVSFTSLPKGSGCTRTLTSAQENNLRLIGACPGQCTWIVKPNVAPDGAGLFMKILPNNVPSGSIKHFRDAGAKVEFDKSADPFIVAYKVSDGASINFDCSSAKDFEMSYLTRPINQGLAVNAAAGANITLTSPFFPGIYPQSGGKLDYNVTVADDKISYLASFHIMDLLRGDTLTIGKDKKVLEFTGSDLPGDVLIPASYLVSTAFTTGPLTGPNPKGAYGFHINLAPTSPLSQTMNDDSKSLFTENKCNGTLCVFIIDLPKPPGANDSVSVNITVTLPKDAVLKDEELLIWDGESVLRSPLIAPIANLAKGGLFPSRSNKTIIVYRGSTNITLSYVKSPCSYGSSTMCLKDRTCMPFAWRCDGKLQCSDGSDEFQCQGGKPPNPQPEPAPTSSGWKVAFWIFMPLWILLGVGLNRGVPLLLQKLRDSRYHQFHDLGDH